MTWTTDGQNLRADANAGLITAVSLHTADPAGTGANEITGGGYARQTPSFDAAAAGVASLTAQLDFTGPASETVAYAGFWNNTTFIASRQRTTGDATFNAAGEYSITSLDVTSTAAIS